MDILSKIQAEGLRALRKRVYAFMREATAIEVAIRDVHCPHQTEDNDDELAKECRNCKVYGFAVEAQRAINQLINDLDDALLEGPDPRSKMK